MEKARVQTQKNSLQSKCQMDFREEACDLENQTNLWPAIKTEPKLRGAHWSGRNRRVNVMAAAENEWVISNVRSPSIFPVLPWGAAAAALVLILPANAKVP